MIGSKKLHIWVEQYLFFPNTIQQLLGICMMPLTLIYCVVVTFKRVNAKQTVSQIPIISIGNLIVGGSGKTPVILALAKTKNKPAIILRGYNRTSKGLVVVSHNGNIKVDVNDSGDEAMLLAQSLSNATVIVSANRSDAITKAIKLGSKVVFLDDGYRQHHLEKFDILIRPKQEPTNLFCLPSGGYKDSKMMYSFCDMVLKDGTDFKREVKFTKDKIYVQELPKKLVLLTAISKHTRLLEYLPKHIKTISYPDHYYFKQEDINNLYDQYPDYNIITTQKDIVKLEKLNIKNIYVMHLDIIINEDKLLCINQYIKDKHLQS